MEAARLARDDPRRGRPYSKKGAVEDSGIGSRDTWDKVEMKYVRVSDRTYAMIETFFGWEPGSILRYLDDDGREPGPPLDVSDIGGRPRHTLSVDYEGNELSVEDRAQVEAIVRRLARNGN